MHSNLEVGGTSRSVPLIDIQDAAGRDRTGIEGGVSADSWESVAVDASDVKLLGDERIVGREVRSSFL